MDWFMITFGGAALYSASRWVQSRLRSRKAKAHKGQRRGVPLKAVVAQCEAKWFLQELQEALSGDHAAMVRVSHMLLVGYGTRQDEAAAASWMRKAWALQNFKEPADPYLQYEMLDFKNSDIPQINDPQQQQQQQQQQQEDVEQAASPCSMQRLGAAAAAPASAQLQKQARRSTPAASSSAVTAAPGEAQADYKPQGGSQAQAVHSGYNSSSSSSSTGGSSRVQAGTRVAAVGYCDASRYAQAMSHTEAGSWQAENSHVVQQQSCAVKQQQQRQQLQQQQQQQHQEGFVQAAVEQSKQAACAMHEAVFKLVQQHSTAAAAAAASDFPSEQQQQQQRVHDQQQLPLLQCQVRSCTSGSSRSQSVAVRHREMQELVAVVPPDFIMQCL